LQPCERLCRIRAKQRLKRFASRPEGGVRSGASISAKQLGIDPG
jgi:hypothetical protein